MPANAQSLSAALTRLAPALRAAGIEIESTHMGRGRDKHRWIYIREGRPGDAGDEGDA